MWHEHLSCCSATRIPQVIQQKEVSFFCNKGQPSPTPVHPSTSIPNVSVLQHDHWMHTSAKECVLNNTEIRCITKIVSIIVRTPSDSTISHTANRWKRNNIPGYRSERRSPQNLTDCSLSQGLYLPKISPTFIHNLSSNLLNLHANQQTKRKHFLLDGGKKKNKT